MLNNPTVRNFPSELAISDMAARDESSAHLGVLCLSEPRADIRMWAHYGDENRGVAVGLDFDNETSGIGGVVCFDKSGIRQLPSTAQSVVASEKRVSQANGENRQDQEHSMKS